MSVQMRGIDRRVVRQAMRTIASGAAGWPSLVVGEGQTYEPPAAGTTHIVEGPLQVLELEAPWGEGAWIDLQVSAAFIVVAPIGASRAAETLAQAIADQFPRNAALTGGTALTFYVDDAPVVGPMSTDATPTAGWLRLPVTIRCVTHAAHPLTAS